MARLPAFALAVALLLTGCGDSSSTPSAPSAAAPSVVPGQFRCPDPHAEPAGVVDHGSLTLPTGARAVRLCKIDDRSPWTLPRGVLTTGLDAVVAVVDEQQVHHPDPNSGCGGVGAPAWSMVFEYDGGTRTITGDNGSCWDLLIGGVQHVGSRRVFDAYLDALLAERRAGGSPDALFAPPGCPHHPRSHVSPAADPRRLVTAVWCDTSDGHTQPGTPVTHAQLDVVRRDVRTSAQRQLPRRSASDPRRCHALPRSTSALLVGLDAWGEPTFLAFDCDSYLVFGAGDPRGVDIRMLPSTIATVAALEGR